MLTIMDSKPKNNLVSSKHNFFCLSCFLGEGVGIQRVIYFCYRDKKSAERWFERNKDLTKDLEVLFVEFSDIRKKNPKRFFLKDDIKLKTENQRMDENK